MSFRDIKMKFSKSGKCKYLDTILLSPITKVWVFISVPKRQSAASHTGELREKTDTCRQLV
jgi:hypothetical protein